MGDQKYPVLKAVAVGYFVVLSAVSFFATWINVGFDWFAFALFCIATAVALVNKKDVYLVVGWVSVLFCGYLVLALVSDHVDYAQGMQYKDPWLYFGFGYLFVGASLVFSSLLIYAGCHWDQLGAPLIPRRKVAAG